MISSVAKESKAKRENGMVAFAQFVPARFSLENRECNIC